MSLSKRARIVFGVADLTSAALVALGVFAGLPDRYAPVDVGAAALVALLAAAGGGLLAGAAWGERAARVSSGVCLVVGLCVVGAVAVSASYLAGIYGPVGRGGAVIFVLVGALATPYLIVLPAVQLAWLGRRA